MISNEARERAADLAMMVDQAESLIRRAHGFKTAEEVLPARFSQALAAVRAGVKQAQDTLATLLADAQHIPSAPAPTAVNPQP